MQFGNTSLTYFIKRKKYQDQILEDIDAAEEVLSKSGNINLKSFDLHDELNDKVWDKEQNLKPGIREQLLQIAQDFYDTLDIAEITEDGDPDTKPDKTFNKYIKDVLFVGSLASFNYSSYADVDLHLLMDEDKVVGKNKLALNILKKYFTECKNDWNLKHSDLTVEGYDCELYVQDVKEENASNGVYSLFNDKWLKKPQPLDTTKFDRAWVEKKALDYIEQIDNLEETIQSKSDLELIEKARNGLKKIKDKIVQGRRDSLASGEGEMNKYNILFKILRRSGHIGKINDLTVAAYDIINSFNDNKNNFKKGNNMKTDESIVVKENEVDAIAEFGDMYGQKAAEALKRYLAKRSRKSAEEVLNSDDEFDKFANWAYKYLNIDVYEKFAKYDTGTFRKRTSALLKNPEQSEDKRNVPDIEIYTVTDAEDNFDSATDTWKEPSKFDDSDDIEESVIVKEDGEYESHERSIARILNTKWKDEDDDYEYRFINRIDVGSSARLIDNALKKYSKNHDKEKFVNFIFDIVNFSGDVEVPDNIVREYADKIIALVEVKGEAVEVTEDEKWPEPEPPARKARMILGASDDDEVTFVMTSTEPKEEANKVLKELGGEKWTKDTEYSYWYFTSPFKIDDVKEKLKPFENTFKVEVQESKIEEDVEQPATTQETTNQQTQIETVEQPTNSIETTNKQTEQTSGEQITDQTTETDEEPVEQQPKESEATAKIVGGTWDAFIKNIEEQTLYKVDSSFKRHPNQWIELIDKSGIIYDAEVTKYSDGEYELLYTNIHPVPNVESKKPSPLNESYADDTIDNIKAVLRKYFEVDPETEEENPEFDENFTAQEAIDEIVDILY